MKLATLKNATRDGHLVVVSADQTRMASCPTYTTMQSALDHWDKAKAGLYAIFDQLNDSTSFGVPFDIHKCHSPLPRAYQFLDGSTYTKHVELARKSRGQAMPETFFEDPLMYQGGCDIAIAPCDPICVLDEAWGIDFEAEVVVITDDVPMGVTAEQAASHIQLIMLMNDVSYRNLVPAELAKGFGFINGKGQRAFSPFAITPDELGSAWHDGILHVMLCCELNGVSVGRLNAGVGAAFNFPQLIAHAAKTRALGAGTVIGSGTVSNNSSDNGGHGIACLVEKRMLEKIEGSATQTSFMKNDDSIRIYAERPGDESGLTLFGEIEQRVKVKKI